jgi:hypothetical protein
MLPKVRQWGMIVALGDKTWKAQCEKSGMLRDVKRGSYV